MIGVGGLPQPCVIGVEYYGDPGGPYPPYSMIYCTIVIVFYPPRVINILARSVLENPPLILLYRIASRTSMDFSLSVLT